MIFFSVALAAECDVRAAVDTLKARGQRDAYDCARQSDAAKTPLLDGIIADPSNIRLTRAMALWLLERGDEAWDPEIVARLPADDRRLLADGVRARRGRKTPSAAHEAVFTQLGWYRPVATYNDARLTATDHANIKLADDPPPLSRSPEPATVAATGAPSRTCGCGDAGSATPGAAFLFAFFSRRSRARIQRPL